MTSALSMLLLAWLRLPVFRGEYLPFSASDTASTVALITVPLGVLLLLLARLFWRGNYLGLVAGYKSYGVADPARMGRFVGAWVGALGLYNLAFPVTVKLWGEGAFIAYIFVIVGIGVALVIGSAYFERG